ncbi:MAG: hypothetical protein AAGP08_03875 [Pseudomonadota bacterium]
MAPVVVISLLAALAMTPASAKEPVAQCEAGEPEGVLRLEVFDLGGGMTSHLINSKATGTHLIVTSCHTGKYLQATVIDGRRGNREYPEAVGVFEDATTENAVVTITQLAEGLEAAKVPTVYGVNRRETCACAVKYPGLRGTKEKFGQ